MIPANAGILDFEGGVQPTHTYQLHTAQGAVHGFCEGLPAMEQAVYKILQTERYEYPIYSWNYGVELADLFGKPIPFVYSEIKRRVREALLQDDRVTQVSDFTFSHTKGAVTASFTVQTTEGDIRAERTVAV